MHNFLVNHPVARLFFNKAIFPPLAMVCRAAMFCVSFAQEIGYAYRNAAADASDTALQMEYARRAGIRQARVIQLAAAERREVSARNRYFAHD